MQIKYSPSYSVESQRLDYSSQPEFDIWPFITDCRDYPRRKSKRLTYFSFQHKQTEGPEQPTSSKTADEPEKTAASSKEVRNFQPK